MFRVGNKYAGDTGVYCGRPTALGNPYEIGACGDRDEACDLYEVWFNDHRGDPTVRHMLNMLLEKHKREGNITLLCYCAPRRCHCDTIARYLNNLLYDNSRDA
jgi:hypothetical protein